MTAYYLPCLLNINQTSLISLPLKCRVIFSFCCLSAKYSGMGLLLYNHAHSFQMEAVTFCYILHEVFHVCEELDGIWSLLSMRSKFIT